MHLPFKRHIATPAARTRTQNTPMLSHPLFMSLMLVFSLKCSLAVVVLVVQIASLPLLS
jgi:hypothetical protein